MSIKSLLHEIGIILLDIENGVYKEYELEYVNNLLERCREIIDEDTEEYAEWEMFYEGFCEILNNIVNKYERKNTKKTIESTSEITLF